AYSAANRDFTRRLETLNLTQRQCITLELIAANPGTSQIEIAEALGIDRSSMMAIAEELNFRKLVARQRSKADGRRQELRLTPRGKAVLKQVRALVEQHDKYFAGRFSKRELGVFVENLRRVHQRF
ncbi:MAG: MarR family transcriptional regulator, partial [Alphaproteobacteria bacterium]